MRQRILDVIENTINIKLQEHQGWVELVDIVDDEKVIIRFRGACNGCGAITETLNEFVIPELKKAVKGIVEVEISEGVAQELIELAKSLLTQ